MHEKERFQEKRDAPHSKVKSFQLQGVRFVPLDASTVPRHQV